MRSFFPHAEARTTALAGALSLYCISLQVARLMLRPLDLFNAPVTALDGLAFLAPTLLLQAGFALLAFALIGLSRSRRMRKAATVGVQALAITIAVIDTAGHAYFLETGSSLDFALLWYSLGRLPDVIALALNSLSPAFLWAIAAVALGVAVLPWIADRRMTAPAAPARPRTRTALCCAALLCSLPLAASGLGVTSKKFADKMAARDPVLNVFATFKLHRGHRSDAPLGDDIVRIERDPAAPERARNLVIIILESTRADLLTPWNPALRNTPFLASLAQRSLRFDRFYSVQPHTARALRAILCGFEPQHRISPPKFTRGIASHCLANLLREQGYRTVYFQAAGEQFEHRAFAIFGMGYHDFIGPSRFSHEGFQRVNYLGYEDDSMLAPSRAWLEAQREGGPFFATYLTLNAHYHCTMLTRHPPEHFSDDSDLNCYLNALRSDDFFLQALFEQYKSLGLYENTLFAVLADHGEAFGEHERRTHNDVPFEEGLRIPLLLHDPGCTLVRPGVRKDPASQLDLLPTFLSLLGFRVTAGHFQGISLLIPHPQVPIRAACYDPHTCMSRIQGDEKFIHHFGRRPDQLFDLKSDPRELVNLAPGNPERVQELRADLLQWHRRVKNGYDTAPVWMPAGSE